MSVASEGPEDGGSVEATAKSSTGDGRLWMSILVFLLFAGAGVVSWEEYLGTAVLLFAVAALGPLAFIASEAYAAGKREEALGRIEVARIEAKGGDRID